MPIRASNFRLKWINAIVRISTMTGATYSNDGLRLITPLIPHPMPTAM